MIVLAEPDWTARRDAHGRAVDELLAGHLARRSRGQTHPVQDFLFTYYRHKPARLRRWHPGLGVALDGVAAAEQLALPGYTRGADGVVVDPAVAVRRRATATFVGDLLRATASRPAQLACFGLHEWAMVYRAPQLRHPVPLRLGAAGTDAVVEAHPLRCTHHDAFRFFTPEAAPRNASAPSREDQVRTEQPGCLHATMDLYKWSYTLEPLVSSELVLRCLRLARDVRELDMRASPYDLAGHGYDPVPVETAAGRATYAREQAALAARAAPLRVELLAVCAAAIAVAEEVAA